MLRRCVVGVGVLIGVLSGCTGAGYQLPDRNTPAVREEERRLAALLPGELLEGPGSCEVRLLGTEGGASFAWATCQMSSAPGSGVSLPVRVDGDQVRTPADGAGHADSVRQLFPRDLADAVLQEPDRLRP
jgi:hypothetical protein